VTAASLGLMAEVRRVVCPHCGKAFEPELLTSDSARAPEGYKCPHCRLFVPADRAAPVADEPAA
jgi:DNA-directed RNA polymerase subunit RPC12/RpoP